MQKTVDRRSPRIKRIKSRQRECAADLNESSAYVHVRSKPQPRTA
jgi:hypothetical protein